MGIMYFIYHTWPLCFIETLSLIQITAALYINKGQAILKHNKLFWFLPEIL